MIEIDYTIERDTGRTKPDIFKPVIKGINQSPLLAEIAADNSRGKSTFLQIMAISFAASENNLKNPELLAKINRLVNEDYQSLVFDLTIDNPNFEYIYNISKPNKDKKNIHFIITDRKTKHKEELTPTSVKKQFKLIYDIPNEPLSRLKNLVEDIKGVQDEITQKIPLLKNILENNLKEIINQPKEEEVNALESKRIKIEEAINELIKRIKGLERKYESLGLLCEIRELQKINSAIRKEEKKLSEYKKKEKKQGQPPKVDTGKRTSIFLVLSRQEDEIEILLKEVYDLIMSNFSQDIDVEVLKNKYKRIDIDDTRNTPTQNTTANTFIIYIEKELRNLGPAVNEKNQESVLILKDLIHVLSRFEDSDYDIPGINMSPDKLLKIFNSKIKDLGFSQEIEEVKNRATDLIREIRILLEEHFKYYIANKDILKTESGSTNYIDYRSLIKQTQEDIRANKKKEKNRINSLSSKGVPETKIKSMLNSIVRKFPELSNYTNIDSILNLYERVRVEISSLKRKRDNKGHALSIVKEDFSLMKRLLKRKNKYSDHRETLESYLDSLVAISHDFEKMNNYLKIMQSNGQLPDNDLAKRYIKTINMLLAKKLKFVTLEGNNHPLKEVNYFKGYFILDNDKKIYFNDLGTGNTQSNYLRSLLRRGYNQPLIVLFDETAMMANHSLHEVYKEMKKLYNNGSLLAGIVIKAGEKDSVKDICKIV